MITELFSIGKYIFIFTRYAIENRKFIISMFGVMDISKYALMLNHQLDIIKYLKNKINFYTIPDTILLIKTGTFEETELGEFEILYIE